MESKPVSTNKSKIVRRMKEGGMRGCVFLPTALDAQEAKAEICGLSHEISQIKSIFYRLNKKGMVQNRWRLFIRATG